MLWMPLLFNFDETRNKMFFCSSNLWRSCLFKEGACFVCLRVRTTFRSCRQVQTRSNKFCLDKTAVSVTIGQWVWSIGFFWGLFGDSVFILPFHIHLVHTRDIAISKCSLINTIIIIPCIFKLVMKNTLMRIVRGLKLEAYELAGIVSSRLPTYGSTYQSTLPAQLLYCCGS